MKKITYVTLLLSIILMSCSQDDDLAVLENEQARPEIELRYSDAEQDIINLVNSHRLSNGLGELSLLNLATLEAQEHTAYMIQIGELNHDNFAQRHQNLVRNAEAKSVAENVAYGYRSARSVVNAWLNSEGHRRNIENSEFTHFGISMKQDENGKPYYTNIFLKR